MPRVIAKAQEIGAKYYIPRNLLPKNISLLEIGRAMRNNYQWLRNQVKQGYEIIDIGLDAERTTRGIFYEAEKRWLELWGK